MAFARRKPADIGVKAPFPDFVEPALASSTERVPSGSRWIHEIKFDGYRVQVHLHNEAVKVFTRRGHDWTNRFKKAAHDAWHIEASSAVIDGEIVVPAADGTTDFSVLQNELRGSSKRIVLVAFDLLYLNGRDLRKLPLHRRKAGAQEDHRRDRCPVQRRLRDRGPRHLRARLQGRPRRRGFQGPRQQLHQRTRQQLGEEDLRAARDADDRRLRLGLYVGRRKGDDLVYAGKVDHGFDKASTAELRRRLEPLIRKTQPYAKRIAHKGVWVEPKLLAEIEYRAKSAEGKVRHPFFKGLREDL